MVHVVGTWSCGRCGCNKLIGHEEDSAKWLRAEKRNVEADAVTTAMLRGERPCSVASGLCRWGGGADQETKRRQLGTEIGRKGITGGGN